MSNYTEVTLISEKKKIYKNKLFEYEKNSKWTEVPSDKLILKSKKN